MQNKMISYYNSYEKSTARELWHVYGRYSDAKERSYNGIRQLYDGTYDYYDIRIISHSCNFYSTGAICYRGSVAHFRVETAYNTFVCGYDNGSLYDLQTGEVFYNE